MAIGDKSKLNGIQAGAQVNPAKASTAQAQAGVDDTAYITSLKAHQAFNQYGFGAFAGNTSGDADAQTTPGSFIWLNTAATNKPAGTASGLLFILSAPNTSTLSQIFVESQSTGVAEMWLRVRNNINLSWGSWEKFL